MKFRLAKLNDLSRIVDIRYSIRDVNDNGIFAHVSKPFIRAYYKIALESKTSICVCAEDADGIVQGIAIAFLDSEQFDAEVKKKKLYLIRAAISSLVVHPALLGSLWMRYRSLKREDNRFVSNHGPRGGFWGWNPVCQDALASYELHERLLATVAALGVQTLHFEVDKKNKHVYKFHKMNGAQEVEVMIHPDGRERALMYYDLQKHKSKIL